MNWASSLYRSIESYPNHNALWTPKSGYISFANLGSLVRKTQRTLAKIGVSPGDHVLLLDLPGPHLYAAAIAIVSMGATILFVEPWLPIHRLNAILDKVKAKVFWSPLMGQLWASRIAQIRQIPHWIRPSSILHETNSHPYQFVEVSSEHTAILSFTSGTSGQPKGIPRTHGYLETVIRILTRFDPDPVPQPTMAIFPNLVLYHLSRGRTTFIVPPQWPDAVIQALSQWPAAEAPQSVACGPAFLEKIMQTSGFPQLRWIGVGGALLDCELLDAATKRFPATQFELIYGSTEVEPVAHADGREALQKCRDQNYAQLIYLGKAIEEISIDEQPDALWVTGPHVTKEYVQAGELDQALKRRDEQGRIWHNMGDRVIKRPDGLWYHGRSFQKAEDFELEQKVYWFLQSTSSFICRNNRGKIILVGENIVARKSQIMQNFSQIDALIETKIVRDLRHRSRIDRKQSSQKIRKKIDAI